ncbi:MAG: c-type cytochrome domain-containing protein, partial [Planctomyces sp.]
MDQQTAIRHDQHHPRPLLLALSGFLMFVVLPEATCASEATEKLSYNRDVRPILADKCFHCHGPDAKTRKADLRLDTEEGSRVAASDGVSGHVIQPGKPDNSLLIERIRSTDESTVMPPPESKKPLTPAQVEILTRWISEGAEYQKHWSFEPVRDATPPNAGPSAHPVDQFLNAEISRKGLTPQPEASRETLIRRVAFTLTGLPPRPEEVEAYLSDHASG